MVIGGGTAGLTMAYRLAENGTNSVAVIEAGGYYEQDNGNTSVVPAYCPQYGAFNPESANQFPLVDWPMRHGVLRMRTCHYRPTP